MRNPVELDISCICNSIHLDKGHHNTIELGLDDMIQKYSDYMTLLVQGSTRSRTLLKSRAEHMHG